VSKKRISRKNPKTKRRKKMAEKVRVDELTIDGTVYVPKEAQKERGDGKNFIVRTYSAGVFYGEIESKDGKNVVMTNARRLWYWSGAASLSQLAVEGTKKPGECKFPVAVPRVELTEAIEILDLTPTAKRSLDSVKVWEQ
jgi:hypothetical protein